MSEWGVVNDPYRGHICVSLEPSCTCAEHAAALRERDALRAELADLRPKYAHLLAEVDAQDQASSWAATGSDRTVTVNERLIQDDQRGMTPDEIERHVDRLIAEREKDVQQAYRRGWHDGAKSVMDDLEAKGVLPW